MRSSTFNWEDARYFLAVARAGQMGKAAASLNISTITLSRHLSYLQQRTGTPLFTRLSRGLKLTDEGLRLMHYLERAEAEIEAASEIFRGPTNSVSGTVRIAAPEGFALRVLTPQLNALLEANPDLNLEIVPQSRGFSLSRREADIAVMVGKPTEPNLDSICLGSYSLGLYASRPYLDKFGVPKDIEGLANHRLIGYVEDLLFSDKLNTPRSVWSQWHSQAAIYSPIGQVEAVKAGLGVGVLHRFLIKETDDLIRLIPEIEVQREFYLVYHQSTEKVPRIGATLEFMKGLKVE
ncbi:HTH-type transcriptional regulator CynR [Marinobacterium sp. xm-a-121]|uniref:LysR family transcriptional regulator n=1 Tax=unclassified Marinobacterium TaxID=2644139 RepID=UPI0015696F33|nr:MULTISPECIES: LysR family transcriptional regulator [unclassified Marinobacterium]NRP37042.1 HTH-type transcriptional regulator CynR [Marinobacterium sp. xm-d-579]NRP38362.1 HTH-type transcriptional regulator CynR [Marinobacterium sp. xm-a-121]NRP98621.1 HTH-type transcriptional regulator CynR [Marinobacterium sp. xm-v-233]